MYSTNNKTDKFMAIAKIGGTCITITIWCVVGVWIYRQTTKPTQLQPQLQPVETVNDSAEIHTKIAPKSDLDIENFKPQLNESTWGEVEDIIKSFEAKMRECEGFDGENKTACYNHYKTQFWRKMKATVSEKN